MKNPILLSVLVLLTAGLSAVSYRALSSRPVRLLLLKVGEDPGRRMEAYHLALFLNGAEPTVEMLRLDSGQRRRALQALAHKDRRPLMDLARELGDYRFASVIQGTREGWPWYLGGDSFTDNSVSTLRFADKCFLAWTTKAPPPPAFNEDGTPAAQAFVPGTSAAERPVELHPEDWVESHPLNRKPAADGMEAAVKVEILNDCGIKGAADAVARALERPGVEIVFVGNTGRFRYRRTGFQSSVGIPVALQEILELTGIPAESVDEIPAGRRKADVTVIVGRDYKKILEHIRARNSD